MLPERKFSEILTNSKLDKKTANILVEGESDQTILREFFNGTALRHKLYPASRVSFDLFDANVLGGNKGRLYAASTFLSAIQARRIVCVIDRDGDAFHKHIYNSCGVITDLSCVEIYPLDISQAANFIRKALNDGFDESDLMHILSIAREISVLRWMREEVIPSVKMADYDKSLTLEKKRLSLNVQHWIGRSKSRGGTQEEWKKLEDSFTSLRSTLSGDPRDAVNIHILDEIFRYWFKSVFETKLHEGWIEQLLRGFAEFDLLKNYKFFESLLSHCEGHIE
ncbi:hypothetical protein MKK55_07625 [Methylobacterium sp. J-059]|uniref:hypothetical protein n=1 Tax=Methylobacterium sp. J-059 TaxID=2836643 RepID=UPI001FBBF808|nr:hypothetical protein [Methylobacterium sp. J-059]MCJ2038823.1 hypothetical protein [Methylobacterium sp. J-059]